MLTSPFYRTLWSLSILVFTFASPTIAQNNSSSGTATEVMEGRIGNHRIGLNITVKDYTTFVAAHYYYASTLTNIPLTGAIAPENVILTEPGEGIFHLHLTTNDASVVRPLTFSTSTGLNGTWTKGLIVLPVTLAFETDYVGRGPARWYEEVTSESDAAFEWRVHRFLQGAIAGNREEVVSAASFPLHVQARRSMVIRNRAELIARWSQIFTPHYVTILSGAIPHEMFVHNGQAMVANGAAWFGAKGAVALNIAD